MRCEYCNATLIKRERYIGKKTWTWVHLGRLPNLCPVISPEELRSDINSMRSTDDSRAD